MREIKIYKVKNSDNLFWTGKYKKMDNRGKSWLDYNDLTRDLNRLKNIPDDWTVLSPIFNYVRIVRIFTIL